MCFAHFLSPSLPTSDVVVNIFRAGDAHNLRINMYPNKNRKLHLNWM